MAEVNGYPSAVELAKDNDNPEDPIVMEKRIYYLQCEKCGGKAFKLSRIIEEDSTKWAEREMDESLCHPGFGWELNQFTFTCIKCNTADENKISFTNILVAIS